MKIQVGNAPGARWTWRRVVLVLVAAFALLAACGQQASPTPAAGPMPTITVPIEMPVVISISGAIDEQMLDVLDEQIAAFEAENPDVFVEIVQPVGDSESIREELTTLLAQADPSRDIYVIPDLWIAGLAEKGWLAPLDGYVARFLPAAGDGVVYDGVVVGLPWKVGERVLVLSAGTDRPEESFRAMAFLAESDQQAQAALEWIAIRRQ